jgi:predicted aspartyl protease
MIGVVKDLQANVAVTFLLPQGRSETIQFVIDTGFAGALALSPEMIEVINLPFELELDSILADGTAVPTPVYLGKIIWQGNTLLAMEYFVRDVAPCLLATHVS